MRAECLAKSEMTPPQDLQQLHVINLTEQVSYVKQTSVNNVIIIRWLAIFFCLSFWYGLYRLVKLFIW